MKLEKLTHFNGQTHNLNEFFPQVSEVKGAICKDLFFLLLAADILSPIPGNGVTYHPQKVFLVYRILPL